MWNYRQNLQVLSMLVFTLLVHLLHMSDSTTIEVQSNTNHLHNELETANPLQNYTRTDLDTPPCPPWYIYKAVHEGTSGVLGDCSSRHRSCREADNLPKELKCSNEEGAELEFGFCITYDDKDKTFQLGGCNYFQLSDGHNITKQGFIKLPDNTSQLNDYMCLLMHREGPLCSKCIDGYGLTLTSTCSKCSGVWYGVPLYLIVELVPITVLYFVILMFRVNITSAPMTCYILYSHILFIELLYDRRLPAGRIVYELQGMKLKILKIILGTVNLQNLRFIVPPFCISSTLQPIHVSILEYLSAMYTICLILFTWLCIELHGRNFRPLVWVWKPFHRCLVRLRSWDTKSDLIDAFASFFLLSYSKLMFQSLLLIDCMPTTVFSSGNVISSESTTYYDRSMPCNSKKHVGLAVVASFLLLVFNILPALLLVLYPVRAFRTCLSTCKLDGIAITTFVNKFHGCYRDGLQGGKDMRSLSGFYFFLRMFVILVRFVYPIFSPNVWLSYALLYGSSTLLIAYLKPYKKMYMNIFDILFLSNLTSLCLLSSEGYFPRQAVEAYILMLVPTGLLVLFIVANSVNSKVLKKVNIREKLLTVVSSFRHTFRRNSRMEPLVDMYTNDSCNYSALEDHGDDEITQERSVPSTVVSIHDDDRTPLLRTHTHNPYIT